MFLKKIMYFSRFVYGRVKDFKSTAFGVKLYTFAQEMQIETIKEELIEFFKKTKSSEIFALFDLYFTIGNQVGLDNCKLVRKSFFRSWNVYFLLYLLYCPFAIRSWRWIQNEPLLPSTG
jgi:hypothetical protein